MMTFFKLEVFLYLLNCSGLSTINVDTYFA